MSLRLPPSGFKGRGALSNPPNRYDRQRAEAVDDGWFQEELADSVATTVLPEPVRSVISYNDSPDIPFDRSINPYRGCEHGCPYCFARPSHAYLGLSPGLDFETKLFYKADAPALLRQELARKGYRPQPIMLGANTDPYQPLERRLGITRSLLQVLSEHRHPAYVLSKASLVLRDADLLAGMAANRLVRVYVTLTTRDRELKRRLEPRAASHPARLQVIRELSARGVPVGVLIAPVIPAVNDHEIEALLEDAASAGADSAGYVLLRLPLEVAGLFREWLATHMPGRAAHVMSLVQEARGGRDNSSAWGERMRGTGIWAQLLRDRFHLARRRCGLASGREATPLDVSQFRPPSRGGQMDLGLQAGGFGLSPTGTVDRAPQGQ
jgi:DNA repair photolyase